MERWSVLLCAADDADATALTFVKRSIERWDDLLEAVAERAWDWHDGGWNGGRDQPALLRQNAGVMSSLHTKAFHLNYHRVTQESGSSLVHCLFLREGKTNLVGPLKTKPA